MNKFAVLLASLVANIVINPTDTEASGTDAVKGGDTLSKVVATDFTDNELSVTDLQIKRQLESKIAEIVYLSSEGLALYADIIALTNELKAIPYLFGGNTVAGFDWAMHQLREKAASITFYKIQQKQIRQFQEFRIWAYTLAMNNSYMRARKESKFQNCRMRIGKNALWRLNVLILLDKK